MELRTKARRLQAESGLDLVIVDYLQLMQATTTNRGCEPRPGGLGDLARPQGARPRAVGAGHRAVAAVPPAGDARVQGAAPLGPARVGRDRAGRGPGDVPLAREGEGRRGGRRHRRRGHQPQARQAPQRPHRRHPAVVPQEPDAIPELRGPAVRRGLIPPQIAVLGWRCITLGGSRVSMRYGRERPRGESH